MKIYTEFHGQINSKDIGKILREIVKKENQTFKILTGYGSTSNISKSKSAAIQSLKKMKKEGLIKGFIPGEVKYQVLTEKSPYYEDKIKYQNLLKNDIDYGNEGIIYVIK